MAIVFMQKITNPVPEDKLYTPSNYFTGTSSRRVFSLELDSPRISGFSLFWGGLTVGVCNLLCGVAVGMTGATAAISDAADPTLFVRILVVEVFASIMGLFGLISKPLLSPASLLNSHFLCPCCTVGLLIVSRALKTGHRVANGLRRGAPRVILRVKRPATPCRRVLYEPYCIDHTSQRLKR